MVEKSNMVVSKVNGTCRVSTYKRAVEDEIRCDATVGGSIVLYRSTGYSTIIVTMSMMGSKACLLHLISLWF